MGGLSSIHFWDLKKLRLQSLLQTTQMYQVCHTIDIDIGETITDFPIAVLSSDHPVNKVGILTSLVHHNRAEGIPPSALSAIAWTRIHGVHCSNYASGAYCVFV